MQTAAAFFVLAFLLVATKSSADVPGASVEVAGSNGETREVVPVPAVPDSMAVPAPTVGDEVEKAPPDIPPGSSKAAPKGTPSIPPSERHESAGHEAHGQ